MSDTSTTPAESPRPQKKRAVRLTLLLTLAIPAFAFLMIWLFFLGPKMRHDNLVENGIQVPGRLIGVDETGTVVNDSPELELIVEFTRKDGTLDTASTDFVPNRRMLHIFQEGAAVIAAYDPEDPEEITVVSVDDGRPDPSAVRTSDVQLDSLRRATDSLARQVEEMKRALEQRTEGEKETKEERQ